MLLVIVGAVVGGYLIFNYEAITFRLGAAIELDIVMGAILVLLVLEGTRRVMGWPLPTIAALALLYAFFGDLLPGALGHSGIRLRQDRQPPVADYRGHLRRSPGRVGDGCCYFYSLYLFPECYRRRTIFR